MKDDKYVEEKAKELYNKYAWAVKGSLQGNVHQDCKDFIRTIIEECKPKVSREYIVRWANFWNDDFYGKGIAHTQAHVKEMMRDLGVEADE